MSMEDSGGRREEERITIRWSQRSVADESVEIAGLRVFASIGTTHLKILHVAL